MKLNILLLLSVANLVLLIVNNLKLRKMADDNQQAFQAVMDDIDNSTNEIAAELESLRGVIQNAGIPKGTEDQILAKLTEQADRLRGLGTAPADPNQPAGAKPTTPGTQSKVGNTGGDKK